MKVEWTKRAKTEEEKEKIRLTIQSAHSFRVLLSELLEHKISTLGSNPSKDYSESNWALMQADKLGQTRAYKEILNLIDLKENNDR